MPSLYRLRHQHCLFRVRIIALWVWAWDWTMTDTWINLCITRRRSSSRELDRCFYFKMCRKNWLKLAPVTLKCENDPSEEPFFANRFGTRSGERCCSRKKFYAQLTKFVHSGVGRTFRSARKKKLLFACLFGCFRNASYMLILYLFLSHPSLTFSRTRTHKQTLCLPFLCLCFAFLAKPSLYLLFSLSPFLLFSFLLYFLSVHSESSLTHSFSTFFPAMTFLNTSCNWKHSIIWLHCSLFFFFSFSLSLLVWITNQQINRLAHAQRYVQINKLVNKLRNKHIYERTNTNK